MLRKTYSIHLLDLLDHTGHSMLNLSRRVVELSTKLASLKKCFNTATVTCYGLTPPPSKRCSPPRKLQNTIVYTQNATHKIRRLKLHYNSADAWVSRSHSPKLAKLAFAACSPVTCPGWHFTPGLAPSCSRQRGMASFRWIASTANGVRLQYCQQGSQPGVLSLYAHRHSTRSKSSTNLRDVNWAGPAATSKHLCTLSLEIPLITRQPPDFLHPPQPGPLHPIPGAGVPLLPAVGVNHERDPRRDFPSSATCTRWRGCGVPGQFRC